MHNGQVTHLYISWAISKKKVRHGNVHGSNVCADHEPKPLDIRAETGFPPSQAQYGCKLGLQPRREPGRLKLRILASPEFNINKRCMN